MSFEEYLDENFGSYSDEITEEEKKDLKSNYDKLLIWQNAVNMMANSNKEYAKEDYDKSMNNLADTSVKLTTTINSIKSRLGIEEGITSQHRM